MCVRACGAKPCDASEKHQLLSRYLAVQHSSNKASFQYTSNAFCFLILLPCHTIRYLHLSLPYFPWWIDAWTAFSVRATEHLDSNIDFSWAADKNQCHTQLHSDERILLTNVEASHLTGQKTPKTITIRTECFPSPSVTLVLYFFLTITGSTEVTSGSQTMFFPSSAASVLGNHKAYKTHNLGAFTQFFPLAARTYPIAPQLH